MYQYPIYLPQISNREDFVLTVGIYDDDTGDPIKLDGTATATGLPFTGSAWTITDGSVVSLSATTITIPAFPIGNSLSSLALAVAPNLDIRPGDPILIQDTPTGLNTMSGYVLSYAPASGALVVQIGFAFDFEIRRQGPRHDGSGYIPWYDFGVPDEFGPLIQAQLGSGISVIDVGIIQITVPASTFGKLRGGTYSAALIMTDSVNTRQLFVGQLPVQWGAVSKQPIPAS